MYYLPSHDLVLRSFGQVSHFLFLGAEETSSVHAETPTESIELFDMVNGPRVLFKRAGSQE